MRLLAPVVVLPTLLALVACAAAHTPANGLTHAGQSGAGAAASIGSAGHVAATGSAKPTASAAGTSANDGGPSTSNGGPSASDGGSIDGAAFAACGRDDTAHEESVGSPCELRPATNCTSSTGDQRLLRELLVSLLAECSVGFNENSLHVAFVRGCATHVSLARMQPSGDPGPLACVAKRLGQQRLTCIEQRPNDCVEYMVSTLATQ